MLSSLTNSPTHRPGPRPAGGTPVVYAPHEPTVIHSPQRTLSRVMGRPRGDLSFHTHKTNTSREIITVSRLIVCYTRAAHGFSSARQNPTPDPWACHSGQGFTSEATGTRRGRLRPEERARLQGATFHVTRGSRTPSLGGKHVLLRGWWSPDRPRLQAPAPH